MDFHGQIGIMLQTPTNSYKKIMLKQAQVFILLLLYSTKEDKIKNVSLKLWRLFILRVNVRPTTFPEI